MWRFAAAAAFVAFVLTTAIWFSQAEDPNPVADIRGATVFVGVQNGHGSGVHLGNGVVLTSAHVVRDADTLFVTREGEDRRRRPARTLWASETYDIALIEVDHFDGLGIARLDCTPPEIGAEIAAHGNPANLRWVTTRGTVTGEVREHATLKQAFTADLTVVPGMSGGPVIDLKTGDVVGIVAALLTGQVLMSRVAYPIGFIVPASAVCRLTARGLITPIHR